MVEEIEEKTILLKDKKNVLFEGLPDEAVPEDVIQESPKEIIIDENDATDPIFQNMDELKKDELKKDKLDGGYNETSSVVSDVDIIGGGRELKNIVINPNYVALDK